MSAWPQSLRPVAKYVARGNEVEATNPVVAFYCNLHAAKEAIRLNKGDGDAFIHSLLEKTEALKKRIGPQEEAHQAVVEAHALQFFAQADDEDMTGNVTAVTAKKYFTALCFMDVCKVFKQRSDEVEKKCNFTKSRMIAIQKALRDGTDPRRPELIQAEQEEAELASYPTAGEEEAPPPPPPPPQPSLDVDDAKAMYPPSKRSITGSMGRMDIQDSPPYPRQAPIYESFVDPVGNNSFNGRPPPPMRPPPSVPSSTNSSFSAAAAAPYSQAAVPSAPFVPSPVPSSAASAPYVPSPAPPSAPYAAPPSPEPSLHEGSVDSAAAQSAYNPSIQQVKAAQQNAKHAVSALDFSDYAGAISFLEQSLSILKRSAR